jgi:hypothetical protein
VFTADLTGNGRSDIVTINAAGYQGIGTLSVLLSNGDGSFQNRGTVDTGAQAAGVAAGDFQGDGHQGLVMANLNHEVAVLLGNGDGSFNNAPVYGTGSHLSAVAAGDFTGGGRQDLVTVGGSGMAILLNNGDGTFRSGPTLPDTGVLTSVVVGDFTGSGKQDLAVAGYDEGHGLVSVYLGNGDGTFQAPWTLDLGFNIDTCAVGPRRASPGRCPPGPTPGTASPPHPTDPPPVACRLASLRFIPAAKKLAARWRLNPLPY